MDNVGLAGSQAKKQKALLEEAKRLKQKRLPSWVAQDTPIIVLYDPSRKGVNHQRQMVIEALYPHFFTAVFQGEHGSYRESFAYSEIGKTIFEMPDETDINYILLKDAVD